MLGSQIAQWLFHKWFSFSWAALTSELVGPRGRHSMIGDISYYSFPHAPSVTEQGLTWKYLAVAQGHFFCNRRKNPIPSRPGMTLPYCFTGGY